MILSEKFVVFDFYAGCFEEWGHETGGGVVVFSSGEIDGVGQPWSPVVREFDEQGVGVGSEAGRV